MPANEAPKTVDVGSTTVELPSMPDITPAQFQSFVGVLAAVATVLFKLNVTDKWQAAIVGALVGVYTLGHMIGDALIRRGRARVTAASIDAAASVAMSQADAPALRMPAVAQSD